MRITHFTALCILLVLILCGIAVAFNLYRDIEENKLGKVKSIRVVTLEGDTVMIHELGGTLKMFKQ